MNPNPQNLFLADKSFTSTAVTDPITCIHFKSLIFGRPAKNFKEIFLRTLIRIKHSLYCSQLCIITRQVKSLRHNTYRTDR